MNINRLKYGYLALNMNMKFLVETVGNIEVTLTISPNDALFRRFLVTLIGTFLGALIGSKKCYV